MQKNRKAQLVTPIANKVKSLVNLMKVKKNVMTIISIILTISLILLYVIDYWDIPSRLGIPHDYNWLSYIGSLIGSWATIYGVAQTLKFERGNSEQTSKNEIIPVLNVTQDISSFSYNDNKPEKSYFIFEKTQYTLYLKDEESNKRLPMYRFTVNNRIGCYHRYKCVKTDGVEISEQTVHESMEASPKVFIKIRNIGLGHAIINEWRVSDINGDVFTYTLRSDERFSIESGASNVIYLQLPTVNLKDIKIYFQDLLQTNYVYTMKLEYIDSSFTYEDKGLHELIAVEKYRDTNPIANFKIVSNVYFEDYFPKEVSNVYFEDYFPKEVTNTK